MTPTTLGRVTSARIHAVLPAEDLERARAFYHDTLGFEVEDMPEQHQFRIHAGGDTYVLVYERARTMAEHTVATFLVDDLPATMEEMRSKGVRFADYDLPGLKTVDGIASMPNGESAWFTDPEGNIIAVSHMN